MSMPTFPELPDDLTFENSINQILSSIAMEELALSHIINAEGEKLQYFLGTLDHAPNTDPSSSSIEDVLRLNESVQDMLSTISVNQMYLFGKMSAIINAYSKINKEFNPENKPPKPATPCNCFNPCP